MYLYNEHRDKWIPLPDPSEPDYHERLYDILPEARPPLPEDYYVVDLTDDAHGPAGYRPADAEEARYNALYGTARSGAPSPPDSTETQEATPEAEVDDEMSSDDDEYRESDPSETYIGEDREADDEEDEGMSEAEEAKTEPVMKVENVDPYLEYDYYPTAEERAAEERAEELAALGRELNSQCQEIFYWLWDAQARIRHLGDTLYVLQNYIDHTRDLLNQELY